jgi:hypothetical protein
MKGYQFRFSSSAFFGFAAAFLFVFTAKLVAQDAPSSLTIRRPEAGATFAAPATIPIEVVAVDPNGDIRRVEFYANDRLIGVSEQNTLDPITPGRPREHALNWNNAEAGDYKLGARAKDTLGNLVVAPPVTIHVTPRLVGSLLGGSASWKFYNRAEPPASGGGTLWNQLAFNDENWKQGPGPLGYGDDFIRTKTEGATLDKRPVTAYFRIVLEISDPARFSALLLHLLRDDGAVAYLNGVEVARDNMPDGPITPQTLASSAVGPEAERTFHTIELPASALVAGRNLLAVEVHQASVESSDLSFQVELGGVPSGAGEPNLPSISLATVDADASEPGVTAAIYPAKFQIHRAGSSEKQLSVLLAYEGSAMMGADYLETPREVVIPAGSENAFVTIIPVQDNEREADETVIVRLLQRAAVPTYKIDPEHNTGEAVIHDVSSQGQSPVISIAATDAETAEPSPIARIRPGRFTLTRTGAIEKGLLVYLSVSGNATPGDDYTALPDRVEFNAGSATAELQVVAIEDAKEEEDETVIATIVPPPNAPPAELYKISPEHASAKVVIHDSTEAGSASLEITSPANGAVLPKPERVVIKAVAVDPDGYIPRVEFYDGDKLLGVSVVNFFTAPPPGTPVEHTFEWLNPAPGKHILSAAATTSTGAEVKSQPVEITILEDGGPLETKVWVAATDDEAIELPRGVKGIAPASFTISREGDLSRDLSVFFSFHGSAAPGKDFSSVESPVVLRSGESSATISILPMSDEEAERPETVVIQLEPSPVLSPLPQYTLNGATRVASAVIFDQQRPSEPALILASPWENEQLPAGSDILLIAHAYHPTADYKAVVFVDGDSQIGTSEVHPDAAKPPGGLITHSFLWKAPAKGVHHVAALILPFSERLRSDTHSLVVGESNNHPPAVEILAPKDGAIFEPGKVIEIAVLATDPDVAETSGVHTVDLLADGELLKRSDDSSFVFRWENARPGPHVLKAVATDSGGLIGRSHEVRIMVLAAEQLSFVKRTLPASYIPGQKFPVVLNATPFSGTSAWAVEDHPPQGWVVSEVSEGGVFDPVTGRVKFGPFLDAKPRSQGYAVVPPSNSSGRYEFGGSSAANDKAFPISGDRLIGMQNSAHPADSNHDMKITLLELTSYAAAWKSGDSWLEGPSPIPDDFVTQAGYLWKHGEAYKFGPEFGPPPACWVSLNAGVRPAANELRGSAQRQITGNGSGYSANITVSLSPGSSAYAVTEWIPVGFVVSEVSHEGKFDPLSRSIHWGLFTDAESRVLTYHLTPISANALPPYPAGSLSVDGKSAPVGGILPEGPLTSGELSLEIRHDSDGGIQFNLRAPNGQVCILESSSDLINWVPAEPVYLPDGTMQMKAENRVGALFYRLRTP